jgi:hypothetical protein
MTAAPEPASAAALRPGEASPPPDVRSAMLSAIVLQAAVLAAPVERDPVRWWLKGVRCEIGARQTVYASSDGWILFAYREPLPDEYPDNTLLGSFTIPTEAIKKLRKEPAGPIWRRRQPSVAPIAFEGADPDSGIMTVRERDGGAFSFNAVGGQFPDWRRVVPHKVRQELFRNKFDPALLARLTKAGAMVGAEWAGLSYNGRGPALVSFSDPNAIGLVMPAHSSAAAPLSVPAWARAKGRRQPSTDGFMVGESGRARLDHDAYATPELNVAALAIGLRRAGIALPSVVLDPCGGGGDLASTFMQLEPSVRVAVTDLHPDPKALALYATTDPVDATSVAELERALRSAGRARSCPTRRSAAGPIR